MRLALASSLLSALLPARGASAFLAFSPPSAAAASPFAFPSSSSELSAETNDYSHLNSYVNLAEPDVGLASSWTSTVAEPQESLRPWGTQQQTTETAVQVQAETPQVVEEEVVEVSPPAQEDAPQQAFFAQAPAAEVQTAEARTAVTETVEAPAEEAAPATAPAEEATANGSGAGDPLPETAFAAAPSSPSPPAPTSETMATVSETIGRLESLFAARDDELAAVREEKRVIKATAVDLLDRYRHLAGALEEMEGALAKCAESFPDPDEPTFSAEDLLRGYSDLAEGLEVMEGALGRCADSFPDPEDLTRIIEMFPEDED